MEDAVRISEEAFRKIYEDSFKSWFRTYEAATRNPDLPAPYLSAYTAFSGYPPLCPGLRLKRVNRAHNQLYADGSSIWRSANPQCDHVMRPFSLLATFEIGTRNPVPLRLSIAETPDDPDADGALN